MRMDALVMVVLLGVLLAAPSDGKAQEVPGDVPFEARQPLPRPQSTVVEQRASTTSGTFQLPDLTSRQNFSAAMQILFLMTVLSLAPAILIMMTSFTRIVIVLSLLRQALGTQNLPPNQIIIGLSLFMTFLVMGKTWERVSTEALTPYLNGTIDQRDALARAEIAVRDFMIAQVRAAGNDEDVFLFYRMREGSAAKADPTWGDVRTMTLIPGFVLSELKTAFLMGFKIYLPFLIIDMVISAMLISMGMMMLPPVLISLPFKLLLFVLVDGWRLITAHVMGTFII
ncbi:MAG: flagellar type III secretion system pore protein FliP [Phycisphaerales bacterium]|nr:flagellar type III secretion system pore protein FliP [Phycisphaerales bacterium]